MRGLYAIVDTDALAKRRIPVLPFVEAILDARPAAVQLRDKNEHALSSSRKTLELLRAMQPLCARASVPLFANDRPDLALLARCDGVHLGQDDVPVSLAKGLSFGGASLSVGLSTHNAADIDAALKEPIDYLAIGPIFSTQSKARPSPVIGLSGLREHAARVRGARFELPIIAIGGISMETVAAVGALADCAAVIGALLPEGEGAVSLESVSDRARALHAAILGGTL